jgi:hypothetical protein
VNHSYQLVKTGWFASWETSMVARVLIASGSANTEAIRVDDLKVVCETLIT